MNWNKVSEILPSAGQEVLIYFETTKEYTLATMEKDTDWPYEDGEGSEFNWFALEYGDWLNIPSHWLELSLPTD
jgi:hypothetical protein